MSDDCSKSSGLRNKLQLKKNNIVSTDKDENINKIMPNDTCKSNETSASSVNNKDDSMSDFKSPQKVAVSCIKLFTFKSTNPREKGKSRTKQKSTVYKKKESDSKKLGQSKKENLNSSQPLIESSFFKPKNNSKPKEDEHPLAYVCPLCFKSMKNESIHSSHLKSCAAKNNISTKRLLEIVELQNRQAQERKSLGLLAAPVLQERKKLTTQKTNLQEDSELQLAIALSKSLHEAEQLNELNEIAVLNGTPDKFTAHIGEQECKGVTLERLGFTSNRPVVETTTNRIKKKKLYGLTILQTRTQEERNRLLTERIAEVLIGNDVLTQKQILEQHEEEQEIISLESSFLQNCHRTEERLWDRASLMSNKGNFYVPDLSEYIRPTEKQLELNKEENIIENILYLENPQYIAEPPSKKEQEEKMDTENTSPIEIGECVKEPFVNTLITDWGNALNNSSASDVIIFVKDNKHIWAHRLVFYVRCPNILLDIVLNNDPKFYSTKEKICWADVDFKVAFAFLEFIYCGFVKTHTVVFNDPQMLSSIRCLARKYKVKELFDYLRKVEDECISKQARKEIEEIHVAEVVHIDNVSSCEILESNNQGVNSNDELKTSLSRETSIIISNVTSNVQTAPTASKETEPIAENYLSQDVHVRDRSVSPDMFEDTSEQINVNNCMSCTPKDVNSGINVLLNLINEDLESSSTESPTPEALKELSFLLIEENDEKPRSNEESTKESSEFSKPESTTVSPIVKQKSDISIFIEKIRRQNAKTDSDFDSEIDSPLNLRPKTHGNPFQVRRYNESENFLKSIEQTAAKVGDLVKKPSALSMLESDVQNVCKNLTENLEGDDEIWIDDEKDELFDANKESNESDADNISHHLSQGRVQTERGSRSNVSASSENSDWHNLEHFEFSTLSLPNQEKSLCTGFENIRRHSSTQSQCKGRLEKHRNVSKSTRSPHKLSQSSREKDMREVDAKTSMSTSFCMNDSVFSSTSIGKEDTTRNMSHLSKRKRSSESSSFQNSPCSVRNSLDGSDRGRNVSNKSTRNLSKTSLENSIDNNDAKLNMSNSFSMNDSVFSSTNLEKENEDVPHNSRKRKKSSDSPSIRNSQSSLRHSLRTSNREKNSVDEYFQDIVTSDDDENMEDVSMYTKYKKEHLYNSIADYRAALTEHFGGQKKSSSEQKSIGSEEVNKEQQEMSLQNIDDSSNLSSTSTVLIKERALKDFPEESTDSQLSLTQELLTKTNRSIENRVTLGSPHIYDAETDVENENEDCIRNVRSFSQKSTNFSRVSNDEETNTSRLSISQENDSNTRKPDTTNNSAHNLSNDKYNFEQERPTSVSPILISSSPDDGDVEFVSYSQLQTNDNESDNLKQSEDPDDEIDTIFYQDLNLANVNTNKKEYNGPITSGINDLQDSPILNKLSNVTNRKRRTEMQDFTNGISKRNKSSDLNESNDTLLSPTRDMSPRQKLKRTKQLKVKSVSEGNISLNKSSTETGDIRRFGSTQCESTPERNKDPRNKVSEVNPQIPRASRDRKNSIHDKDLYRRYKDIFGDEEVIITDKDVTPPPDYENMPTPELHKELNRYGLKLQKRSRAVKLLNYIYNETHPLVPLSNESHENQILISDAEDENPVAEKASQEDVGDEEEDSDMLSQNSNALAGYINPEEMEFDEPEPGPSTSDNPKSVGEAFAKLIKGDRDLHNQILMYEPINLMEVHATLKANGFRCNVNVLMDYLDEQCITFCIPENSVKSRTRKKQK